MARITAIATAVPDRDIQAEYSRWATSYLSDPRAVRLFERMSARSGIGHRWSVLKSTSAACNLNDDGEFYGATPAPATAARMAVYAAEAPELALRAVAGLGSIEGITHLVVASCTGFCAPGIDQIIASRLNLGDNVERVLIGFMGCYAAITALRTARHIVRSQPDARVLVITVELSTLHLQATGDIESLLAMSQFGDGAAAALVTGGDAGLEIGESFSQNLPDSGDLITWTIGDTGFVMRLSGEVPGRITAALARPEIAAKVTGGAEARSIEAWAIHAGGRSILDAVEHAFNLPPYALAGSRAVLEAYGNMSSATLMFALAGSLGQRPRSGVAMAFGPGMAVEGFQFRWQDSHAR